MEPNEDQPISPDTPPVQLTAESEKTALAAEAQQKRILITVIVIAILLLAGLIAGVVALVQAGPVTTSLVRDLFIIFMALESMVLGVALIILITQLATLINLLRNEIKPILQSTNETVNTLRGTTVFISDNLVEPIMKLNEYMAALKKVMDFFKVVKR